MRSSLEESAMTKQVSEETALPPSPDNYFSIEEVDIIKEEDALRDSSQDASRRRIFEVMGLIKSLLFADDHLTRESLMDKRADFADHEIDVCLLVVIRLKPYIPSKANYESIGHQLPFIILANDLLRCAGYARFNRNMCPMPSASPKAFRMNAGSLYSLYCNHGQQKLRFFKYDGTPLQRAIDVHNHKDAVFNSFFDMASIQAACKRNKLIFAHNITILPGLQHVRLLGTKTNKTKETAASLKKQPSTSNIPESTWQEILPSTPSEETEAGLCGCLPDIFNIIRNAVNKLRGTQSGQQELPVALPIEVQKKALDDIQKEISQLINLLKEKRYKSYLAVEECKRELSDQRFNLYIRRRALAMPKKDKGKQKAEKTLKLPFSLERYVYHLKLHNRFAALMEQTEPGFQPLPEAKTISAEDVDFASRNFHYRHELALMKRNSPQVAEAEAALSHQNFTTVKNEEDVWNAYRCLQDNKNVMRSFYQNTKMKKGDMRGEMFMKKSKDRICARERLWLNLRVEAIKDRKGKQKAGLRLPQKQLIMVIGDRGMGVGSRIKQHLRYGGI
ncbi:hypothetical protein EDC96DRAFT_611146 [Choanephora cucurbitarum]|nr:hypothetical protein EDC96DRAFT_611146 [Choanephora cucurbitarum]